MARKSKSLTDYKHLAEQYDLTFEGEVSPPYVSDSTLWGCKHCGRLLQKSYNNVKFKKSVCPCRWQTLTLQDYHSLGETLNIHWSGSLLPVNTKTPTVWEGCGQKFEAAYNELAYGKIPRRLREFIPHDDSA